MTLDVQMTTFFDLLWGGDDGVVVATFAMATIVSRTYEWPLQAGELRRDSMAVIGGHGGVWVTANLLAHRIARRPIAHPTSLSRADLLPRARSLLVDVSNDLPSRPARSALKEQGAVLLSAGQATRSLAVVTLDSPRPHSLLLGWGGQVVRALDLAGLHGLHVSVPVPGCQQPEGQVRMETTGPARRVAVEGVDALRRVPRS